MKKLSEMAWYMKPEEYANGTSDNTGPETREIIERLLDAKPEEIFLVGDSEEGFDCEYLEALDEIIGYDVTLERNERYDEEYDTELVETLYETKYGNICVVEGITQHGTISIYFALESTGEKIQAAVKNVEEEVNTSPLTLTANINEDIVEQLMERWGCKREDILDEVAGEFTEMMRNYYGLNF